MIQELKKYLTPCFKFIKNHIFTISCIILFYVISSRFEYFLSQKKIFLISSISLIFIMHIFSKWKLNIIFTILFSLIVTINFYCAFELNTYFNAGLFGSIMDTSPAEASSMSKDILKIAIPMFLLSFFLIFMSMRELRKSQIPLKISVIASLVCCIVIIPYNAKHFLDTKYGGMTTEISEHPLVVYEIVTQRTAPIFYGNLITVANYIDERIKYRNFYNLENKELAEGISYQENKDSTRILPQKIYLIIGESATRERLSLYGYHQQTTPYVDSLSVADSSQFKAYIGYSSATITRDAFRQILTTSTPHNMNKFLSTKSLIDMANDRNYETVWISPFEGVFRQHSGTYIQLLATSAQVFKYSPDRDDLNFLEFVHDTKNESKSQFILVGLNGSHGSYADGCDEIDEKALPYDDSLDEMNNSYNRTIHHTDRFLKAMHEIILQDSSSVMIYLSDHGEIIGKGHGMREGRAQIEIPIMFFNNSDIDLDNIISKYTYTTDSEKALNSLAIFNIIAELMGYHVSPEEIEQVLKESQYVYFADKTVGLASEMKDGKNTNP